MWKNNFSDYVTGIAFNLQLSKSMCDTLIKLSEYRKEIVVSPAGNFELMPNWSYRTLIGLERRGLIEHVKNTYMVTEAGRMTHCLVKMAFDLKEKAALENNSCTAGINQQPNCAASLNGETPLHN